MSLKMPGQNETNAQRAVYNLGKDQLAHIKYIYENICTLEAENERVAAQLKNVVEWNETIEIVEIEKRNK